jgi:hypothetical protein
VYNFGGYDRENDQYGPEQTSHVAKEHGTVSGAQ